MSPDLFDALPDPAALLTAEGEVERANPAFVAAFRHKVSARRPAWGRVAPPPFDESGSRRFDGPAPDGRLFEWRETQLADGRRLAVARDVSDRAAATEEASRAKTLLFATLTHELRTPLNGILGMAGLLRHAPLDAAGQSYLDAIRASGEHLLDLITEILDFSRLESGRITLEEGAFDPEATAEHVAELLSPRAREKGVELVLRVDRDTPGLVRGDEGRLRQILFNLVGNAVKFTESGSIAIDLAPRETGLRFSVRDTGPGVPYAKQAAIFEAFSQADASHARRYGGAGLGLAIVKKLADAMGGRAGLSSRPGRGATFWVDLPLPAVGPPHDFASELKDARFAILADHQDLARAMEHLAVSLGARARRVDAAKAAQGEEILLADLSSADACAGRDPIILAPQEDRAAVEALRARGWAYLLKPVRRRSLAAVALARLGRAVPATYKRREDEPAAPPHLGLAVLVAEDNPVNAMLARALLQRCGCMATVVQDGEEAVAAAAQGGFDLILLDLRMPRLDGFAAARRIRGLAGPASRTPILALTADAGEEERQAALAAGMDDFLTKPIDPARLAEAAAIHARQRGTERAGARG